jgi:catechol-2,3-dioxygenase
MTMVAPSKFAHVVFATHRFEEMVNFYLTTFEARAGVRNERLCFATYDDEHHRFAFVNLGPADDPGRVSKEGPHVVHLAYTWDDLTGLIDVYKRVRDAFGQEPTHCLKHGPTLSFYYEDPDGNELEFQLDLLDVETANEFMTSPAFEANPAGEQMDPAELVRRLDAGEPVDDLVFRADQPRSAVLAGIV